MLAIVSKIGTGHMKLTILEGPQVGIFFIAPDGEIISTTEELRDAKQASYGDFVDSKYDHNTEWPKVRKYFGPDKYKEYYEIPRGRILYNKKKGVFYLYMPSKLMEDENLVGKILSIFKIPMSKVVLMQDMHYEDPEDLEGLFD